MKFISLKNWSKRATKRHVGDYFSSYFFDYWLCIDQNSDTCYHLIAFLFSNTVFTLNIMVSI